MGFIILKQPTRIKHRLPRTESLRRAQQEHRDWLKSKGLDNIKPKDTSKETLEFPSVPNRQGISCGNRPPIAVPGRQEAQQYSGERRLVGIATMHKSNQVPVFADDEAEGRDKATEISQMRRN
jgi:hypothetical protein